MTAGMIRQTIFTTGEIDPINYKRTDSDAYLTTAQRLLNVEVGTTGLAKKRRGTKFLGDVSAYVVATSQSYEFVDKNNNYYILISTNLAFNVFDAKTLAHLATIVTPYLAADLIDIDYSFDNSVIVLTHSLYPPARIYITSYGPVVFAYQVLNIAPYPAYDFANINYSVFTAAFTSTAPTFTLVMTGVGAQDFSNAWIGGVIIGLGNSVTQPVGYGIITSVDVTVLNQVTFTGNISIAFAPNADMPVVGSQYSIQQPAWSVDLGYPEKVLFYQNRLWLANTTSLPGGIFGSKINNPVNYDIGVGADTDAIVYNIGGGPIQWLNAGKQLEIYLLSVDSVAPQNEAIALTPSTFAVRQQSAYGSTSSVKPINYINDSYFVSKTGNSIINFHFEGVGQAYTATNISLASSHLVKNPINRALQRGSDNSQDNFIYYLNADSSVTCFQFAAEEKLAALTPIDFDGIDQIADSIIVKDIVSINNTIYFLKYYTLSNIYTIEIFEDTKPMEGSDTIIRLDGYITATMQTSGLITGLSQFNGYNVHIVFNNQDYGTSQQIVDGNLQPGVVAGGQCYAFNPNELTGTVLVGLLYDVNITPMFVYSGKEQSNFYKNFNRLFIDYYQSLNFYINGKLVEYQYYEDIQAGIPIHPRTDTAIISAVSGWKRFSTFSITQSSPFDLQITAIAYQIDSAII